MAAYSAAERRELKQALDTGKSPTCPACGEVVTVQPVQRPRSVSYVRRRVLVVCPGCRRTAAVDVAG